MTVDAPSLPGASSLETVEIPVGGVIMRAHLAHPASDAPAPGILLFHEIFGLNEDMAEKARRFASMGYVALAPDLYAGRGIRLLCVMRTMRELGRGSGGAFDRIEAARAWLASQPFVDASRLGVCGFCMGGGFAILDAARAPYGAAAVLYGRVPRDASALDRICPVVGGYGGRDRSLKKAPGRLEAALTDRAVDHDVKVYPDAGHGYMSSHGGLFARLNRAGPMKVGFNAAAADDSWDRIEAFFASHLDMPSRS